MGIAMLFLLQLAAVLFAWFGRRYWAISFFAVSFILSVGFFYHHMTDVIGLAL